MNFTEKTNNRFEKGKSLIEVPSKFVVFDIETTGLDPFYDEIIEIGAIKVKDGIVTDTFSTLIKPEYEISEFITELTGITNEMVKDAPKINEVLPNFITFIEDDILVGHNVNFDINFIYDNLVKINQEPLKNDFVDTLRLSRRLLPNLSHHRLIDLTEYYKINNIGGHRAIRDTEMTLEVLKMLCEEIKNQYGNFEKFKETFKRKSHGIKASDIVTNRTDFDVDNLFFDKNIAITGTLAKMSRKEAMQIVVDLGGHCEDRVTSKTNFLILGNNDYNSILKGNKSSKLLKAEELKMKGQDIEILSENVFYDVIDDYVKENSISTTPSSIMGNNLLYNGEELTEEEIKIGKYLKQILLDAGQDCTYLRFTKLKNGRISMYFSASFLSFTVTKKYKYLSWWEYAIEHMEKNMEDVTNLEIKGKKVFEFKELADIDMVKKEIIYSYVLEKLDAEEQIATMPNRKKKIMSEIKKGLEL